MNYVLNAPVEKCPPELCSVMYDANSETIPIDEKTDVWMVGAVIYNTEGGKIPQREDDIRLEKRGKLTNMKMTVNGSNKALFRQSFRRTFRGLFRVCWVIVEQCVENSIALIVFV
jgi:hypothetical protein